jgi:hypothetical protein
MLPRDRNHSSGFQLRAGEESKQIENGDKSFFSFVFSSFLFPRRGGGNHTVCPTVLQVGTNNSVHGQWQIIGVIPMMGRVREKSM